MANIRKIGVRLGACSISMMILAFVFSQTAWGADDIFDNAYRFYETYGTSEVQFADGAFYYCSKGSQGKEAGIHYAVAGQRFTLETEEGNTYTCSVALEGKTQSGSCKRISYVTKNEYRYSLYRIEYDVLYQRFCAKYPEIDFSLLLYNRPVRITVDFYLCIAKDGEDQGSVAEQADGSVKTTGQLYLTYEGILHAAPWSERSREALKGYYKIHMAFEQASSYSVVFHKGSDQTTGKMRSQHFVYGKAEKLKPCTYSCEIMVFFDMALSGITSAKNIQLPFLGWSRQSDGAITFSDCNFVKNLSKVNLDEISLYARWGSAELSLPDLAAVDADLAAGIENRDYGAIEFLGWSTSPQTSFLDAKRSDESIVILEPGTTVRLKQNVSYYAVYGRIQEKVTFRSPHTELACKQLWHYTKEQVMLVRTRLEQAGGFTNTLYLKLKDVIFD